VCVSMLGFVILIYEPMILIYELMILICELMILIYELMILIYELMILIYELMILIYELMILIYELMILIYQLMMLIYQLMILIYNLMILIYELMILIYDLMVLIYELIKTTKVAGGGGGGGRISIHASDSNAFVGELTAFGGRSAVEAGGAGTIYKAVNKTQSTLIVDNDGLKPVDDHVHGVYITIYDQTNYAFACKRYGNTVPLLCYCDRRA